MSSTYDSEVFKNARRLHDVPYLSRYNDQDEYLAMEAFIRSAATAGLADYLVCLFYDSRACFCDIETVDGLTADDPEGQSLIQAATGHISQFHLFGAIGPGK
ncbi:hypothetical protein N7365_11375 [Pseudomonas sediminis]|uniref:hypothetical protein n=1 Tax=Pseudomonas sediminis TaxID=1691904 RepID=UPI002446BAF0|nr:hypothetical protein [Pseudomonas sediminis]MDG9758699.1 hypothetical protein [Pseudomonas sediminis]